MSERTNLPEPASTYHEAIDMQMVYAYVAALPDDLLRALELGPRREDTECTICRALRYPEYPNDAEGKEPRRWLVNFHGTDAMRCGVIYGMARAIRQARWEAGIERLKREHPEAYR